MRKLHAVHRLVPREVHLDGGGAARRRGRGRGRSRRRVAATRAAAAAPAEITTASGRGTFPHHHQRHVRHLMQQQTDGRVIGLRDLDDVGQTLGGLPGSDPRHGALRLQQSRQHQPRHFLLTLRELQLLEPFRIDAGLIRIPSGRTDQLAERTTTAAAITAGEPATAAAKSATTATIAATLKPAATRKPAAPRKPATGVVPRFGAVQRFSAFDDQTGVTPDGDLLDALVLVKAFELDREVALERLIALRPAADALELEPLNRRQLGHAAKRLPRLVHQRRALDGVVRHLARHAGDGPAFDRRDRRRRRVRNVRLPGLRRLELLGTRQRGAQHDSCARAHCSRRFHDVHYRSPFC